MSRGSTIDPMIAATKIHRESHDRLSKLRVHAKVLPQLDRP